MGDLGEMVELPGTPPYLAPEMARGEVWDEKADIFSLGVMVLESTYV